MTKLTQEGITKDWLKQLSSLKLIQAMSPEASKRLKRIDRFKQVYHRAQANGLWA